MAARTVLYHRTVQLGFAESGEIKSFGHAGDGNLHAYILKDDLSDEEWETRMKAAMEKIYQKAHELKGQVSGEHGIRYAKKPYFKSTQSGANVTDKKKRGESPSPPFCFLYG